MNLLGEATLTEILSQPQVWQTTAQKLAAAEFQMPDNLTSYKQIIFTGCGSTYYLSQWAARLVESSLAIQTRATPASQLLLFPDDWLHKGMKTLLVAVSRSGETSETLSALDAYTKGNYGDSVVVTCYPESRLAQMASTVISVPDGQEISTVQTRSFTSMMIAVTRCFLGKPPKRFQEQIGIIGQELIENHRELTQILGRNLGLDSFFFLGNSALFGLASEAMLKMKETSISHSEAYHFLEFRHGPKAVINSNSLVVGLLGDKANSYELDIMKEMKELGATLLIITDHRNSRMEKLTNNIIAIESDFPIGWRAPLYLPLVHLLAYNRAVAKGIDCDHPHNLNPVVLLDNIEYQVP